MAQSASKSCDICLSGPGRNYCEQCDQWMCENCKTLHLRSKMCTNHTFLGGSNINPEEKTLCKEHDEKFIFYCIDCNIPICKMCIVKKHKTHDSSEINESTQELQSEVKNVIDSRINSVKTNLHKIEQSTGRYQSDVKEAIRTITEDGRQMKLWIDKKVETLINSLEEQETATLQALQIIRTEFQNDMDILKKCQNTFADSQTITDATKRIHVKQLKHIKSELDITGVKQSPVMPTVKYNNKNVSEREVINLFGDISFREIGYSMEKTSQKKSRQKLTKALYIYECEQCGNKISSEKKPLEIKT